MHELSITRSLLDQALAETEKRGYKRINRIHLLLGEGGSVVPECVQFYFDEMKKGTAAAGAKLEFKKVPLRIRCPKCGAEWGADLSFRASEASRGISPASGQKMGPEGLGDSQESCPGPLDHILQGMCGCNAGGDIISGQELVIESIDVD